MGASWTTSGRRLRTCGGVGDAVESVDDAAGGTRRTATSANIINSRHVANISIYLLPKR